MSFSRSTFIVEVNNIPTIAFQAKWAVEAENVAFGWATLHSSQLSTKGTHGTELPSVIKIRIARLGEKAAYEAGGAKIGILRRDQDRLSGRPYRAFLKRFCRSGLTHGRTR